jgi:transcriptional regulator with XRE-family HTH domain
MAKFIRKKKGITLDDLAGMVKRGFDGVDKRFEGVDKRFEQIAERLDRFGTALKNFREENTLEHEEIKLRLSQVAYRFELEEMDKRLKRVEAKVGIIKIR